MHRPIFIHGFAGFVLLIGACSGESRSLTVGYVDAGSAESGSGPQGGHPGPGGQPGGDGGNLGLDVEILVDAQRVDTHALACGGCAEIEAVASDGTPPYTYTWNDHVRSPTSCCTRHTMALQRINHR